MWKICELVTMQCNAINRKGLPKITDFGGIFLPGFGWQSRFSVLRVLSIMRSNKRTCCCDDDELHASVRNNTQTDRDSERDENDGNCSIAFPMNSRQKQPCTYIIVSVCMHVLHTHKERHRHTAHITCTPFSPIIIK